jgi:hypothetical protein
MIEYFSFSHGIVGTRYIVPLRTVYIIHSCAYNDIGTTTSCDCGTNLGNVLLSGMELPHRNYILNKLLNIVFKLRPFGIIYVLKLS